MLGENILYIAIFTVFGVLGVGAIGIVIFYIISMICSVIRNPHNRNRIYCQRNNSFSDTSSNTADTQPQNYRSKDPIRQLSDMLGYGNAIKGPTISEKDIRTAIKNLANKK